MRALSILLLLCWQGESLTAQNNNGLSAQQEATLPSIVIFSGSDWCLPCIRLEKEIFSTPEFLEFSQGRFEIVKADFPQRKKLNKETVKRNENLAAKHNPNGIFPYVVLLKPDGSEMAVVPIENTSLALLISDIKNLLAGGRREFRKHTLLMGSSFEFVLVDNDPLNASKLLTLGEHEVARLENLLSEWKSETEVSQLNGAAGYKGVTVSEEVYQLTKRCLALSAMTQGAFDISFHGMDVYSFDKKTHPEFPDTALIKKKLKQVGYEKIKLEGPNRIFLSDSGMSIGFGASGKGFAADEVKKLWTEQGVKSGVINASGDLVAWGKRADGTPWKVGIADPDDISKVLYWIPVENQAVATSGNYEKYFEYKGERYAHIINPKTGFPVKDKKSVTVFSRSAELSDALATALFVLDIEVGLDLIRQLPQTECIIIDSKNEVHFSDKLNLLN